MGRVGEALYLFTLYGKNEERDLTADEKMVFRRVLEWLQGINEI